MVHPRSWIECAQERSAKLRKGGRRASLHLKVPSRAKVVAHPKLDWTQFLHLVILAGRPAYQVCKHLHLADVLRGPILVCAPLRAETVAASSTPLPWRRACENGAKNQTGVEAWDQIFMGTDIDNSEADLNPAFQHFTRGEWNSLLKFNRPIELGLRRGGRRRPWRALGLETWRTTGHRACLASLGRVFVEVACPLPF